MTTIDEYVHSVIEDLAAFEREDDSWDEPPILAIMLSPDDVDPERVRLGLLDVSDSMWARADTYKVIEVMGIAIGNPDAPPPPFPMADGDEAWATIIRTEGWALAGPPPPAGLDKEARQAWFDEQEKALTEWSGRIVDHPHATEVKIYSAVTNEGHRHSYTVWRRPKHPLPGMTVPEDGWADMNQMEGRMFDALDTFMAGMRRRYVERFGNA